ncbi:MAG: hypothetical protein PHU01_06455, partial [Desulfuromonadaceae bacterium]|nr:hypothetical protein [Desulfuromonadaceae bacterium]
MRKINLIIMFSSLFSVFFSIDAAYSATCDQYPGDTWIYGGITSSIKPNILIIIDTSGSMGGEKGTVPGTPLPYDPTTTYTVKKSCDGNNCTASRIYKQDSSGKWKSTSFYLTTGTLSQNCNGYDPKTLLSTTGQYNGRVLKTDGSCNTTSSSTGIYATGNWINWNTGSTAEVEKIVIAREVVKSLISSTTGVNLGVMVYNNKGSNENATSEGSRFFTNSVSGSDYTTIIPMDISVDPPVNKDMDDIFVGSTTYRQALYASIDSTNVVASGSTPMAESLYEAGQYFSGSASAFSNTVGLSGTPLKYTTPITSSCQKNYIIFVTDGMSKSDDNKVLETVCPSSKPDCKGDYDNDGAESKNLDHSMDDVAKYLYDNDLLPDDNTPGKEFTIGNQNISTFAIFFGTEGSDEEAVALLQRATDNDHGHGASYKAGNQSALTSALTQVISSILSVDSSFVAPVVPVSPDNRTYNSNRIFMGFFKPVNQTYWEGNLKKYGLDVNNNIIDKNSDPANWVDSNGDRIDDNTNESLPSDASNGTFRNGSTSYWSSTADAGEVNN